MYPATHRGTCEVFEALRRALVPSAGRSPHAELPAAVAAPGPRVAVLRQGKRVEVARRQSRHRLGQVYLLRNLHQQADQGHDGVFVLKGLHQDRVGIEPHSMAVTA